MTSSLLDYMTSMATYAALQAGDKITQGFNTTFDIHSKEGVLNWVTSYDKASEGLIVSFLHSHFPDHQFLAEEGGLSNENSSKEAITWVIDPIDGTLNFAKGLPFFVVSIAAVQHDEVLCGVIYQPVTKELFVAKKGGGTYCNGKKVQVSSIKGIDHALLCSGFPSNISDNPGACLDHFLRLKKHNFGFRDLGASALNMAYVACGKFDAFWFSSSLQPWDFAAGKILVEEAGGLVTRVDQSIAHPLHNGSLLTAGPQLHAALAQLFNK